MIEGEVSEYAQELGDEVCEVVIVLSSSFDPGGGGRSELCAGWIDEGSLV